MNLRIHNVHSLAYNWLPQDIHVEPVAVCLSVVTVFSTLSDQCADLSRFNIAEV